MTLQSAIRFLYPPQCLSCASETAEDFALCGTCWQDTPFISGLVCNACGVPLPGEDFVEKVLCDACLTAPNPWSRGRAAVLYSGVARKLILSLKHGDRLDLARPMAGWMQRAGAPLLAETQLIAPVPLHWKRLLRRRYNQAALLGKEVARGAGLPFCPDLLWRSRATSTQERKTRQERFDNLAGALRVRPNRQKLVQGNRILLIDDVMTTGATLAACTEALMLSGATTVNVLVLARVARDA